MRVLHLNAGNLYGGIETLLATLARHEALAPGLASSFGLCFEGRSRDELLASGSPVHLFGAVRISRPWLVCRARRRLAHVTRERPGVVIAHGCWPHVLFAPVARSHRVPLVFWAHSVHGGRHWLERWAGRTRPDFALADSRSAQASLVTLFGRVASEAFYPPVPAPALDDRASVRRRVRAALDTPQDAVVLVQTSRVERAKGHALLLQALGRLADAPDWRCWVAGGAHRPDEREYLAELERSAADLGIAPRVRFLGPRTDVPELLAAADIHCQPNVRPDAFGIAFIEALYAGLPVVTTAIGGALEIVDDTCGILVPPGDLARWTASLARLIREPDVRARLGSAGPARARQLCDPAQQMTKLSLILAEHGTHAPV